ncbi:MAG: hypothetical protein AUH92_03630 [Acidobacteria bacterium 13_1_40CM_4_69_4]|nr:MAG: hypothetical protein AUH92_03630 [Acidobacteria bacterium 13_1_40CM_4_69_4]
MGTRSFPEPGSRPRAVATTAVLLLAWCGAEGLAAPGAAQADDAGKRREARRQDEETRLEKVRRDIVDLKGRLERTEATAGSVLDALEELDLRMALLEREAESLRVEARRTGEREMETRFEARALEGRLAETEADLRGYLREAYKIGPARYLRVVAAASSPSQVAAGYRAIEALSLAEALRIESFRADRRLLDLVLADLQAQEAALHSLETRLQGKARDIRDVRARKQSVLAGLQREQASQRELLSDLVQVEQAIQMLLSRLAQPGPLEPVPSLGFARFRGLLEWPARGRLAVPYGNVRHPRFSTEVPHPGIDIAAAPGQDVRAVFDGRVVFSDWFKGYGQMVVIDQDIGKGDPIARSGEDGSFDQPGLYFEIRHDGRPEDPARWLRGGPGTVAGRKRPAARDHRESRRAP